MKILVAEKDLQTMDLISTRLEVRGYEVQWVKESYEILRILERESPALYAHTCLHRVMPVHRSKR